MSNLFKTKKQMQRKIDRLQIKNIELKERLNKLMTGTLDKSIITDYENRIGALKTENYYLKNQVDSLNFYKQIIDEQDVDDIQKLIKVLAIKSMCKGE